MSLLVDQTRRFWLPGINAVRGLQQKQIAGWLADSKYQIYSDIRPTEAVLNIADISPAVAAFAAGASSMASASFETAEGITPSVAFPKSTAWLIVRSYYAAFFAAHALLRMWGKSCSQFEAVQLAPVVQVADLYGHRGGVSLAKGLYLVETSATPSAVHLRRLDAAEGAHGGTWSVFYRAIGDMSDALLAPGESSVAAQASAKLVELRRALTNDGTHGRGTWLSHVRNRTNYQLAYGAWHPYSARPKYFDQLFGAINDWKRNPMDIQLDVHSGRDLQRAVATCAFIVAYCRTTVADMAARAPVGPSFHRDTSLQVLRRLGIAGASA